MTRKRMITRRGALKLGAAASALPLVHIRTASAAGKVSVGILGPLGASRQRRDAKQCEAWAAEQRGGAGRLRHLDRATRTS